MGNTLYTVTGKGVGQLPPYYGADTGNAWGYREGKRGKERREVHGGGGSAKERKGDGGF